MPYPTVTENQITDAVTQFDVNRNVTEKPDVIASMGRINFQNRAETSSLMQLYAMNTAQPDAMAGATLDSIIKAVQGAKR